MRILIEEYQYNVADVKDILYGIDALENVEGKVSIHYVGYYYNVLLTDCVFILPKVLLKGLDGKELVFGKYRPEEIANLDEKILSVRLSAISYISLPYGFTGPLWFIKTIGVMIRRLSTTHKSHKLATADAD